MPSTTGTYAGSPAPSPGSTSAADNADRVWASAAGPSSAAMHGSSGTASDPLAEQDSEGVRSRPRTCPPPAGRASTPGRPGRTEGGELVPGPLADHLALELREA